MSRPVALIVDDERDIRELIEMAFMGIGVDCILAPTIKDAIRQLKNHTIDFIVTDMRMPDGDGMDLVVCVQKKWPCIPICVITAHGNVELAVTALKLGAFDFINKPFDLKQLRTMAQAALKLVNTTADTSKHKQKEERKTQVHPEEKSKASVNIIGETTAISELLTIINKLARSEAPVLIYGESGTGKELVARSIHEKSARSGSPFVPVNCGAIPENLMESEFFGYTKGAFTGADKDTDGLLTAAHNGTIFLDEVAELPISMQVKLLRAIQEKMIRPVGSTTEIPINARILSATHQNLDSLVTDKKFREDLYYRLNVISVTVPALRERLDDIEVLSTFILEELSARQNTTTYSLSKKAIAKLKGYHFPGNIRELENILERAVTFSSHTEIQEDDIYFNTTIRENTSSDDDDVDVLGTKEQIESILDNLNKADADSTDNADSTNNTRTCKNSLSDSLAQAEKELIRQAMKNSNNDLEHTANQLGLSTSELIQKINQHRL